MQRAARPPGPQRHSRCPRRAQPPPIDAGPGLRIPPPTPHGCGPLSAVTVTAVSIVPAESFRRPSVGWSGVCRPPTAIAGWVRDVPPAVLADLSLRAPRPGPAAVEGDDLAGSHRRRCRAFDAAVGTWLMSSLSGEPAGQGEAAGADRDDPAELMPVRLDGKTVRGARDAVGNQRHHHGELSQYTQQFYEPYARYPAPVFAVPGNHDGDPLPGASSLDGCLRVMATPSRSPLHPSPCPAPKTRNRSACSPWPCLISRSGQLSSGVRSSGARYGRSSWTPADPCISPARGALRLVKGPGESTRVRSISRPATLLPPCDEPGSRPIYWPPDTRTEAEHA